MEGPKLDFNLVLHFLSTCQPPPPLPCDFIVPTNFLQIDLIAFSQVGKLKLREADKQPGFPS